MHIGHKLTNFNSQKEISTKGICLTKVVECGAKAKDKCMLWQRKMQIMPSFILPCQKNQGNIR